jgi:hypothetical protein
MEKNGKAENEKEAVEETSKTKLNSPLMRMIILAAFVGGILATGAMMVFQWYIIPPPNAIITVDLKQIIDHKRNSLVDKYKGAYTEENAKKADEEVKVFMDKLQDRFDEMGKNRLVLLKDVVLGGHSVDVTDKLISYADGNSESKGERTGK